MSRVGFGMGPFGEGAPFPVAAAAPAPALPGDLVVGRPRGGALLRAYQVIAHRAVLPVGTYAITLATFPDPALALRVSLVAVRLRADETPIGAPPALLSGATPLGQRRAALASLVVATAGAYRITLLLPDGGIFRYVIAVRPAG